MTDQAWAFLEIFGSGVGIVLIAVLIDVLRFIRRGRVQHDANIRALQAIGLQLDEDERRFQVGKYFDREVRRG